MIEYFNKDGMVGMARYPDKHFDLAIVDPPYGIGANKEKSDYYQNLANEVLSERIQKAMQDKATSGKGL